MKKLYIILIAALLLTLAACLTACSAKPVSLRGTEAPNLTGPAGDALKVTDEGQDWNITLEQVGLARNFDLLRQLDEMVANACKGG